MLCIHYEITLPHIKYKIQHIHNILNMLIIAINQTYYKRIMKRGMNDHANYDDLGPNLLHK